MLGDGILLSNISMYIAIAPCGRHIENHSRSTEEIRKGWEFNV